FAFFEGTGAQTRNHAYQPSDKINGYTIAEITNNAVKLAAASNQFIVMLVGMQMSRDVTSDPSSSRSEVRGPWKLVAGSVLDASPAGSGQSGEGEGAGSGPGGDVMKRLIEERLAEQIETTRGGTNENHE